MTFLEYFWKLCFRPFKVVEDKTNNTIHKLWTVVANTCERVATDVYFTRSQFVWRRCSWWALDRHGAILDVRKMDSEEWEAYRERLMRAYEIFRLGGTEPGMLLAMETVGLNTAYVVEHYKTIGRDEWAVFSVVVPIDDWAASGLDYRDIDRLIWRWKPAHTLGKLRRHCFRCDNPNSLTDRDWLCI